jgi:N-acetylglutamate synthase-like GNAT family acetyltransferase
VVEPEQIIVMRMGYAHMIEKALYEDLEEILALQKLAYLSEAENCNDYSIPPLTQTLQGIREDFAKQTILKLEEDGKIIGSVRASEKDGVCFIGRVIVHPEKQNKGLGKMLMKGIEDTFGTCTRYSLFTGKLSLRNLHFYNSLGYRTVSQEKVNEQLTFVYLGKINHQDL